MKKNIILLLICCGFVAALIADGDGMAKKDDLKAYRSKRDFEKTPEPSGKKKPSKKKQPIFVIQKHEASHLHYDFRLEIEGVLVSWAIPKGPSTDPAVKHLAVQTEDHPIEYADFEGVIPEGNYGAGTVMIWDYGTYENIKEKDGKLVPMAQCLKDGTIEIFLHGKKLKGGYVLVRTKYRGAKKNWLFFKMKDKHADARRNPISSQTKSALSGKTMKQIASSGVVYED